MRNDQNLAPARRTDGSRSGPPEKSPGQEGEMFTAKELQQLFKISVKTIYGYVQRGLIPYVRIQSNVRFPRRQILEWIARQSYHQGHPMTVQQKDPKTTVTHRRSCYTEVSNLAHLLAVLVKTWWADRGNAGYIETG